MESTGRHRQRTAPRAKNQPRRFAELVDEEAEYAAHSGLLALQDHGKGFVTAFKDIRIKHFNTNSKKKVTAK